MSFFIWLVLFCRLPWKICYSGLTSLVAIITGRPQLITAQPTRLAPRQIGAQVALQVAGQQPVSGATIMPIFRPAQPAKAMSVATASVASSVVMSTQAQATQPQFVNQVITCFVLVITCYTFSFDFVSECPWMFVRTTSSEPNFGMVIHHHEPECQVKRLLCCHQGQGHSEGSYFNRNMTFCYLLNYWTFCSQTLVWWHMIMSWLVSWKDCIAVLCSKSRSQQRLKISLNVHLDHIFSTRPWYNP